MARIIQPPSNHGPGLGSECTDSRTRVEAILKDIFFPDRGVSADVAHAILQITLMIENEQIEPGQRLHEINLAQELGIGRGRLREALRVLAGEGLISLEANKGAYARSFTAAENHWMGETCLILIEGGLKIFLSEAPYLPDTTFQDLDCVIKRLDNENSVREILNIFTDYHCVIHHYTGNPYLAKAHRALHARRNTLDISKVVSRDTVAFLVQTYAEMHQHIIIGSEDALDSLHAIQERFRNTLRSWRERSIVHN